MAPEPRYFSGFDAFSAEQRDRLMADALPVHLLPSGETTRSRSDKQRAAVVCVHGFTGMPYEVMPVAQACADMGMGAITPLLPGHGYRHRPEQKKQFSRITKDGLLAAVRTEVARAKEQYDVVGIYGHSMGGAIALILAAEGLVDACAVSAPAIKLPWQADLLVPLIGWIPFTRATPTNDPFYLPSYQFHHSYAVRALWQVAQQATKQLAEITCPVLGMHTHHDQTIPPVVLELMQQNISTPLEIEWFDPSSHAMPLDMKGEAVSKRAAAFLHEQLHASNPCLSLHR